MKRINDIIKEWKKESGFKRVVQYKYDTFANRLTLYLSSPGYMIGAKGLLVEKYKQILNKNGYPINDISFIETDYFWA